MHHLTPTEGREGSEGREGEGVRVWRIRQRREKTLGKKEGNGGELGCIEGERGEKKREGGS